MEKKKKRINKNKLIVLILIVMLILVFAMIIKISSKVGDKHILKQEKQVTDSAKSKQNIELDWKLILVNFENKLPDNYNTTLESIDEYRKFDSRAIGYLQDMINDMRTQNVGGIWVQSSYRSVEDQTRIYNNKVESYRNSGKKLSEAQRLTEQVISKPGYSEHNLGLAVDFNYVNNDFEKTKEFSWLKQNAEDYGFILRYPKEKENITKMTYEPWHWRYVGQENAKKINELGMCLEEYIEYIYGK